MASKAIHRLRCLGNDLVLFSFNATVGATGAITATGFGGTLARSSAGVYTLTFEEKYPYVQSCNISCNNENGAAAFTPGFPHWSYSSSTGVITITFRSSLAGAAEELADGAAFSIIGVVQTRYILGQS